MRLALTAIALSSKEDHPDLAGMLASAKKVGCTDLVLAVDDRSHENTVEWAKEFWGKGADCFTFVMEADGDPHFANARNLTLARIPKECEWWTWADSDDTIESNGGQTLVQMIERLRPGVGAIVFNYHYADDAFGNPKGHVKGRLYRTAVGWEWRDRVHEDVHPTGNRVLGKDVLTVSDGDEKEFVWVHHNELGNPKKGRNFRCLRRMIMDDPDDPKAWFFLGNQHFAAGNWMLAIEAYERYVPMSGWGEQKYWALVYSGIAYRALGDAQKAIEPDLTAHHMFPNLVDPFFGLGESYCRLGDWEAAIRWGELGFERLTAEDKDSPQKAIPSAMVWFNATSYNYAPYLWMATAYMNRNENEKALSCYKQAVKARPEEDLEKIIRNLEWAMNRERITVNGLDLAAGLVKMQEPIKALNVLTNLPAGSKDDDRVVRYGMVVADKVKHLNDQTSYQNFYFQSAERSDPLDPDRTSDENLEKYVPRMMWALRRLQACGARKVLDIGIGDGTFDFLLARHGIAVVGIDVDWRRAQQANRNAAKAGYQTMKVITLDRVLEFSDDCACEDDQNDHDLERCTLCACEAKWVETQEAQTMEVPEATPESMAQFLYCPPSEITPQVRELGPYDAVVGMELLEHVPDPDATLTLIEEMAPRILLSTPDGAFIGPIPSNPGHVRAYSQRDLIRLVMPHGWLTEIHLSRTDEKQQDQIVAEYVKSPPQSDARVVIFCPPTADQWSPESINVGLGGSETAVVNLAKEFVALGQRVTVYAMCEGMWDGVRYRDAQDFQPEPCETFIAWRNPAVLSQVKAYAQRRFIWTHDVHFGPATATDLEGVTAIALSEWHRGFLAERYPGLDIEVLGNGILPERFEREVERIPHRLIYAQSPDRGLDRVLDIFPRIRSQWPDATLEVFYGFAAARKWYPDWMAELEPRLATTDGVTVHGWVGQDRLAQEYMKADVLLYPAITPVGELFPETYCISVVEAQAGGCFPITSKHGALSETNARGTQVVDFESEAMNALEAFWGKNDAKQEHRRGACKTWARQQTWRSVAERWIVLGISRMKTENWESDNPIYLPR